ncbi:MAG: ATP-binding cassette domain-containing protein, partial [Actinomycetota bacterium]|nr:ATP-binding cassette domain-containing protein [Actinomycetota bacterium]
NQLARALAGDAHDVEGEARVNGRRAIPRSPRQALRSGLALITENRAEEGLFPDMSVRSNISIAALARVVLAPFLRVILGPRERRVTAEAASRTGISPRLLARRVRVLSGGNQQKSLLARWLMRRADVLVLIEPTRGVDVGAKLEIYRQLEELARNGAGVLAVSTDIPEVLGLSDRIAVIYEGRLTAVLAAASASEQELLLAIQGSAPSGGKPLAGAVR